MKLTTLLLPFVLLAGNAFAQSDPADSFDTSDMVPDDQTPLGKFTTAAEIRVRT